MEELLSAAMNQNFIPVVDDLGTFIGIVTRKDIIRYFAEGKDAAAPQLLRKIDIHLLQTQGRPRFSRAPSPAFPRAVIPHRYPKHLQKRGWASPIPAFPSSDSHFLASCDPS